MGVKQVGNGGGNVHATESVEERVSGVLPHPSADEGVGGVVVVSGKVGGGNGRAVKVDLDAVVSNGIAQPSVRDQFDARWWHGKGTQGDDARYVGLREQRMVGVERGRWSVGAGT